MKMSEELPTVPPENEPPALLLIAVTLALGWILLPFAILVAALATEATFVYERLESGDWNPALYLRGVYEALPDWVMALLGRFDMADFDAVGRRLAAALAQASELVATQALGIGLIAWGVLVIGLVDNLLRPVLVGRDTRMPDAVVMITTIGGMAVLSINGFVPGPAIAAMFIAAWHIYGKTRAD